MKKVNLRTLASICILLVCVLITGCNGSLQSGEGPELSLEELQLKLKQEYIQSMSHTPLSCTTEDVQLSIISKLESGYAMLIGCKCSSIDLQAPWEDLFLTVYGDLRFYMPSGWYLEFYKDGDFKQLDAAYNLGWLNYEQLRTVWDDFHSQFPKALEAYQQANNGSNEPPERDSSGLDYSVNEDGKTCTVTGMGVCNDRDVVIPEYIDGYQVTAIDRIAFWNQIRITSVVMPDSIVRIGSSAFEDCTELKSITLSSSLETISIQAFKGCDSLKTIQLPESLTLIDGGAFNNCTALTEVIIPKNITCVSSGIFQGCTNLVSLTLPESITQIDKFAFGGCNNLASIEFQGTKSQWEAITQAEPWYPESPECTINCIDGQIIEN